MTYQSFDFQPLAKRHWTHQVKSPEVIEEEWDEFVEEYTRDPAIVTIGEGCHWIRARHPQY